MNQTLPLLEAVIFAVCGLSVLVILGCIIFTVVSYFKSRNDYSERKRADRMRKVWTWAGRIIRLGVVIGAAFLLWRY